MGLKRFTSISEWGVEIDQGIPGYRKRIKYPYDICAPGIFSIRRIYGGCRGSWPTFKFCWSFDLICPVGFGKN